MRLIVISVSFWFNRSGNETKFIQNLWLFLSGIILYFYRKHLTLINLQVEMKRNLLGGNFKYLRSIAFENT